jgi:hypothetical protein
VGFYYLRGTIYERTQQRYHALRVYLIALNVLEAVYGTLRPTPPSWSLAIPRTEAYEHSRSCRRCKATRGGNGTPVRSCAVLSLGQAR